MRITTTQPLFAWECLDDSPSLRTIREFLGTVPDAKLLNALHRWRGRGRDDYPVSVLWGTFLLTILLRHPGQTVHPLCDQHPYASPIDPRGNWRISVAGTSRASTVNDPC